MYWVHGTTNPSPNGDIGGIFLFQPVKGATSLQHGSVVVSFHHACMQPATAAYFGECVESGQLQSFRYVGVPL